MGNPLAVSLPTKVSHQDCGVLKSPFFLQVSQNWFPVSERLLATGVLAMSLPLGIVCGQGISPQFVVIILSMNISHGVYVPHCACDECNYGLLEADVHCRVSNNNN